MGQLTVAVILRNAREYMLVRHGHLAADQVHTYETPEALVDTEALYVVVPPHVAEQLGLLRMSRMEVMMANGALVLEGLDLAVDCLRGQLMPTLGTRDQPLFRV